MNFYFCEKCGARVTDQELAQGAGRDKQAKGVYCRSCANGVMTTQFEAITNVPLRVEPARTRQPAARAPSPPRIEPTAKDDSKRRPHHATIIWLGAVSAGVILGVLVLMFIFSGNTAAQPTHSAQAPVPAIPSPPAVSPSVPTPPAVPAATPAPGATEPNLRTAVVPSKLTPELHAPEKPLAEQKKSGEIAAADEPTTLRVDFQKESPPGMDGFEHGTAPAGSEGHPMRIKMKPNSGYNATQASVHAILSSSDSKTCLKSTATSVLRLRVYAENSDLIATSLIEGRAKKWHAFSKKIKLTVKNAWTSIEVPFCDLKDGEGQAPAPGTLITAFGVASWGATTGYSIWIDHFEVVDRSASTEKP
jgi:hypothetical protein